MNIKGTKIHDVLFGSNEADSINGGRGRDTIIALDGQDIMKGGKGRDTFVFTSTDNDADSIVDFNPNRDRIVLSLSSGEEFADTFGDRLFTKISTHVIQDGVPFPVILDGRDVATGVFDLVQGENLLVIA